MKGVIHRTKRMGHYDMDGCVRQFLCSANAFPCGDFMRPGSRESSVMILYRRTLMFDIVFIGSILAFFVLSGLLVRAFERL
jgi:hypothetical protein